MTIATTTTAKTTASTDPPDALGKEYGQGLLELSLACHPREQTRMHLGTRSERTAEWRADGPQIRDRPDPLERGDGRASRRAFAGAAHHERPVKRVGEELHEPGKLQQRAARRDDLACPGQSAIDDLPEARRAMRDAFEHRARDVFGPAGEPEPGDRGARGIVPGRAPIAGQRLLCSGRSPRCGSSESSESAARSRPRCASTGPSQARVRWS